MIFKLIICVFLQLHKKWRGIVNINCHKDGREWKEPDLCSRGRWNEVSREMFKIYVNEKDSTEEKNHIKVSHNINIEEEIMQQKKKCDN